jgi:preprotein translocase subunit YajC
VKQRQARRVQHGDHVLQQGGQEAAVQALADSTAAALRRGQQAAGTAFTGMVSLA